MKPLRTWEPGVSPGWTLEVKNTTFLLGNYRDLQPSGKTISLSGIDSNSSEIPSFDEIVITSTFLPSKL